MFQEPRHLSSARAPAAAATSDPELIYPRLVENIGFWCLFPASKKRGPVYIIGSKDLNRYVTVPAHLVTPVRTALALFDGNHSLSNIEMCLREQQRIRIDTQKLYVLVADSGLLHMPERSARATDIERLSLRILDIPVNRLSEKGYKVIKSFVALAFPITIGILVWCGIESLLFPLRQGPTLPGKAPAGWLVTLITLATIAAHEMAHALSAAYFGIKVRRLRIALYVGLLPFIYLSLAGLYTVSVPKRIAVWLAGIYANFVIACGLLILIHHARLPASLISTLHTSAHLNFLVAVVNLVPFIPTDGYYVISTLLRKHNVRMHAWELLASLFRRKPMEQFSWLAASYLICSICLTISMIGRELKIIFHAPELNLFIAVLVLITIAAAFMVNLYQKKGRIHSRRLVFALHWLAIVGVLYVSGFFRSLKAILAHTW